MGMVEFWQKRAVRVIIACSVCNAKKTIFKTTKFAYGNIYFDLIAVKVFYKHYQNSFQVNITDMSRNFLVMTIIIQNKDGYY